MHFKVSGDIFVLCSANVLRLLAAESGDAFLNVEAKKDKRNALAVAFLRLLFVLPFWDCFKNGH